MSAGGFLDACGFVAASSGTGNFVVSSAITGYQTPAGAGAVNSTVYSYRAESADKTQWEEGFGAYTVSGTTLARTTITANSAGGTTAINFSAAPNVFITALSQDLQNASLLTSGTLPAARLSLSPISNALGANVALNNTATFFDGPSINQGSTWTWFVSGTVTLTDTAGAARMDVKLWDGTTVIASASNTVPAANEVIAISLSGYIASPAGNLRMSVRDASSASGLIEAASAGVGGANISAFRIA